MATLYADRQGPSVYNIVTVKWYSFDQFRNAVRAIYPDPRVRLKIPLTGGFAGFPYLRPLLRTSAWPPVNWDSKRNIAAQDNQTLRQVGVPLPNPSRIDALTLMSESAAESVAFVLQWYRTQVHNSIMRIIIRTADPLH